MKRVTILERAIAALPGRGREELLALILCGELFADGERMTDPRRTVSTDAAIEIRTPPFVSRAGAKLELALVEWGIDVTGKVLIDAGCSTGGFTDCLLRRGARTVHAVDVGRNQLAYSLRVDPRVVVHEGTNVLALDELTPPADAAVADLSFRSIIGAAGHLVRLTKEAWLIALLKPQFELARSTSATAEERAIFRGVVDDEALRRRLLEEVAGALEREGVRVERTLLSPVAGRKGNREFLLFIRSIETRRR